MTDVVRWAYDLATSGDAFWEADTIGLKRKRQSLAQAGLMAQHSPLR